MASESIERPCKKARIHGGLEQIITLKVGKRENPTAFSVHKDVLCAASPFFEAACKPEWMTEEDRAIKLPEDEPDVFKTFVNWMYYDEITVPSESDYKYDFQMREEALQTTPGLFARLYVLGDKYQMPKLQNDVVDAFITFQRSTTWIPPTITTFVYENTTPRAHLRSALVLFMRMDFDDSAELQACRDILCRDFAFDLAVSLMETPQYDINDVDPENDFCLRFHIHDGSPKPCKSLKEYTTYFNTRVSE